jgi:hypothetical protein
MDDTLLVRGFEGIGDLPGDGEGVLQMEGRGFSPGRNDLRQVFPSTSSITGAARTSASR